MSDPSREPTSSEILFYQEEGGGSRIQVRLEDGTVWLSQVLLAELFQTSRQNISLHLKNIFEEGELDPEATIKPYLIVQTEGERRVERTVDHYNLEVILAIGYRVRSHRGTQFRRWATERLREYLTKGFVLDDERLKSGRALGADYFDELLERIREIRASEARFYQKIRELYGLAIDYDPSTPETQQFFQIVQNKLHFAVTGKTAAELIAGRVSAEKPNLGLTTWKGKRVRRADVTVAKNYLTADESRQLNRIVTMYLDYAQEQAERRRPLYMKDWRARLDAFLAFNDREVLEDAGHVSAAVARELALREYEKFDQKRLEGESSAPDEFEAAAMSLRVHDLPSKPK